MKSTHMLLILGFTIASIATQCKKYEEGPRLSLHSKKARIANSWKYEQVTHNGTDITASYANCFWELKKDGNYINTQGTSTYAGTWQFASDKEDIILTPASSGYSSTWHIIRLTNDELWVTVHLTTSSYEYHFIPR
ncbi:MAG: hypothetical protein ABIQ40_00665 [Bacteroidia bacterium]